MTAPLVVPELPEGASIAAYAAAYAAAGLPIAKIAAPALAGGCTCSKGLACGKPGKHPLTRNWQAGLRPEEVRQWGGQACNVGLVMGGSLRLVALDVDGAVGRASLKALEAEYGPLPPTATSISGRQDGGMHLLFQVGGDLDLAAIKNAVSFRPGLDVRAAGGQIVAPPSLHMSGRAYRWIRTGAVAELPRWMFGVITAPKAPKPDMRPAPARPPVPRSPASGGRPNVRTRAEGWLAGVPGAIQGAGGSCATFKAALGLVIGFQIAPGEALAMLERIHNPKCEPRWSHDELLHKVTDAAKNQGNLVPGYLLNENAPDYMPPAPRGVPSGARSSAPIDNDNDQEHAGQGDEGSSDWRDELQEDRHGPRKNLHNVALILTHDEGWPGCLAYDEFADRLTLLRCPPSHAGLRGESFPRAWRDKDDVLVARWLQRTWQIEAGPELVGHAAVAVATENSVHPVREYLESLTWDGKPRLETWLHDYLGAKQTAYSAAIGTYALRASVARIYKPGCKVDTMPVLQGGQGTHKSSALRVLYSPQFFTDDLADFGSKDAAMQLRGAWCIEVAELAGMGRAEVERVKAFVSRAVERYRSAYGRHVQEQPRQCTFWGSTNADSYLKDETGNRRFWPVAVGVEGPIDLEGLARDRDQLWAEAVATFRAGKRWHLDPIEDEKALRQATAAQEFVRERDAWESLISRYLDEKVPTFVTSGDLLAACGVERSRWGTGEQRRVGAIIRGLGWAKGRSQHGGVRDWGYVAPYLSTKGGPEGSSVHHGQTSQPKMPGWTDWTGRIGGGLEDCGDMRGTDGQPTATAAAPQPSEPIYPIYPSYPSSQKQGESSGQVGQVGQVAPPLADLSPPASDSDRLDSLVDGTTVETDETGMSTHTLPGEAEA